MAKVFVQDIVPAGKRSIRNIPLPASKGSPTFVKEPIKKAPASDPETNRRGGNGGKRPPEKPSTQQRQPRGRRFSGIGVWAAAAVLIAVIVYAASFLFVSATAKISPKKVSIPVSVRGTAKADTRDGTLGFTIVTLSKEGEKEVPAGGEERVEKKASGKIVIYNNHSTKPQVLVADTRFESTDGLIYRINQQITVPGQKTSDGRVTPGSLTVTVYADQPGDKYNIGLADFTIPGFKGDPRYSKITAKSDPKSPIGGGFVGTVRKVTESDKAAAKVSIETQLRNELQTALASQIPSTHVLFKNATTFDFDELPQESSGPDSATIKETGSIYGILFERNQLSRFIASQIPDVAAKDVHVANLTDLNFSLENMSTFNPAATKEISFKIDGKADFVWNVNETEVSQSLSGQKRRNIKQTLAKFESIDRASVSINPIWFLTLPKNPEKIRVEVGNSQ